MVSEHGSHATQDKYGNHLVVSLVDDMEEHGISAGEAIERVTRDCRPHGWGPSLVFGLPSNPVAVLQPLKLIEPERASSEG